MATDESRRSDPVPGLVAAYLDRLDLPGDLAPTLASLVAILRRHLERVAYTNLEIMLGRSPSVDPVESLRRIVTSGRAGYCFHHNGALELVLRELGFVVRRHHGHVWTRPERRADDELTHLLLVVDLPSGRWWCDVGLGDGFLDPLPLSADTHEQEPFRYRVDDLAGASWSFGHDPAGSFSGLEVRDLPVDQAAVDAAHAALSDPVTGPFARLLVVQRRLPGRVLVLRGITLVEASGETVLTSYDAWRAALAGPLGVPLDDLPEADLRALHARSVTGHHAWVAAGRP